ncbi:MAG: RluA family pseudouridine synthase [Beijerinckiaceae bacterium]|nr:RluA family pseudouridine synthase [Beijerinckiaceae bacterium]MCI0735697.1 RluA family pseudouridine synthase [Beijerinckiaceae bacterium]
MSEGNNPWIAISAGPEDHGQRLDRFLAAAAAAENLSRTRVKALIELGYAAIDGAAVKDPSALIRAGQTASLRLPPPVDPGPLGESIPLDIVFEDEHLLIIDKPAGLVVHPSAGHASGTLVNALISHCGASLSGIGGVRRPGIVHRLDKDTSGLMAIAKTDSAHQGLAKLFADHGKTMPLAREYLAFVWGVPGWPSGMIAAPLARHAASRQKIAVAKPGRGRHAVTHWRHIESFAGEASLLTCGLETGRTHQIRVHLAHLGHPVLGDPVYAAGFKSKRARLPQAARASLKLLSRQALHAAVLGFMHPVTGEELCFTSALPQDLQDLRDALAAGNQSPVQRV